MEAVLEDRPYSPHRSVIPEALLGSASKRQDVVDAHINAKLIALFLPGRYSPTSDARCGRCGRSPPRPLHVVVNLWSSPRLNKQQPAVVLDPQVCGSRARCARPYAPVATTFSLSAAAAPVPGSAPARSSTKPLQVLAVLAELALTSFAIAVSRDTRRTRKPIRHSDYPTALTSVGNTLRLWSSRAFHNQNAGRRRLVDASGASLSLPLEHNT